MREEIQLPSKKEEIQQVASALHAISHPTRLKILCFLGSQEKIVNEILDHTGSSQSNISQHIEVLRKAGIIQSRRVHNKVFCSMKEANLLPIITKIREVFCDAEQNPHQKTLERQLLIRG